MLYLLTVVLSGIALLGLWGAALAIDGKWFGGRYLNKSHATPAEVYGWLADVLREKDKPIDEWSKNTFYWFWDEFFLVRYLDPRLETIRLDIVQSMEANQGDREHLNPAIVQRVEAGLAQLSVLQAP